MNEISEEIILQSNPFKERLYPKSFRACVGDNSGISVNSRDCSIIDGYKDAVSYMMDRIVSKEATIDTLVYPILFCCRHSVELSLKILIKNFIIIYKRKENISTTNDLIIEVEQSLKGHDIARLVNSIDKIKFFDQEIEKSLKNIKYFDNCINDYFFDVDGDSFRYTFKRNWKDTNLENIGLIDLGIFYKKYDYLMKNFDFLINDLCHWLDQQYSNKVFTRKLNRKQIKEISELLPNINNWKSDEFQKTKNEICQKYNITKSELSEAIDIIKNHYKFCTNIGMEKKFKNIREETFLKLGNLISKIKNPNHETAKGKFFLDIVEAHKYDYFIQDYELEAEKVFNCLTLEEKLAFLTFYEISLTFFNGSYQCEDLDGLYKYFEEDGFEEDYLIDVVCNNLVNLHIRKSFEKCGQTTYLQWFDKYIAPII